MHILAVPHGIALAHVTRPLEVAKALRDRGHRVTFACTSPYDRFIERAGFERRPIVTEPPEKALARVREGRRYEDDRQLLRDYVAAEKQVIRETGPDLVLGDFRPTLSISTELLGVPYVTITNACFTRYYAAAHPPPETLRLTRVLGSRIASVVLPVLQRVMLHVMAAPIRRYRREHGMTPVRNMLDVLESPLLNLIADIPEFGPTSGLPPRFRYVGPLIWEAPLPVPECLENLPSDGEFVYLTMGSTGEGKKTLSTVGRGLSELDVDVLVTTGASGIGRQMPEQFHCVNYAPGHVAAARAGLVVCHGGNGTIYQSLAAGTPVLSIPTFFEQECHADRAAALGAGRKLTPHGLRPDAVRDACRQLLHEPRFTRCARRTADRIRDYDSANAAAMLLESLPAAA